MCNTADCNTLQYWLVKFAPFRTSWPEIVRRGTFALRGVRSRAAREFPHANHRSNTDMQPDPLKKLPIPDVSPEEQAPIVALVDKILAAKKADPNADIAALEQEVDARVAALYGVTSQPDRPAEA